MSHLPDIFKVKLAQQINNGLGPLLLDTTLEKVSQVRDPVDPTIMVSTYTPYSGKGFTEDYTEAQRESSLIQQGSKKITVMGASFPDNIYPETGDRIIIEGETRTIVDVMRDPAGATFECQSL